MKLHYFDSGGRAAPIRIALKVAKMPFDDIRHTREDLAKLKDKFPLGQVPVLELDDGTMLNQSDAILEFVADKAGITPSDILDAAWARSAAVNISDVILPVVLWFHMTPEEQTAKLNETIDDLAQRMKRYDKWLATKEKDGYVLGHLKKDCMADYAIFSF